MFRFFRYLLLLAFLLFIRTLLRSLFQSLRTVSRTQTGTRTPPSVPAGGELKKDPVCGTYVSAATAISERVKGETIYFCSRECREKFAVVQR